MQCYERFNVSNGISRWQEGEVAHLGVVAAAAEEVVLLADGQIADRLDAPTSEQVSTRLSGLGR